MIAESPTDERQREKKNLKPDVSILNIGMGAKAPRLQDT